VAIRRPDELDSVIEQVKVQIEACTVIEDGLLLANRKRIAELAIKSRLPSIGFREYCEAGGLAAYGVDFPHIWRRGALFVDKILKGAAPADLPIEQATRFEFVINLRTAKALGLDLSPALIARADEVIE
jgi:putative ABC transport system substrate-binding protein